MQRVQLRHLERSYTVGSGTAVGRSERLVRLLHIELSGGASTPGGTLLRVTSNLRQELYAVMELSSLCTSNSLPNQRSGSFLKLVAPSIPVASLLATSQRLKEVSLEEVCRTCCGPDLSCETPVKSRPPF
jgi:hypothetical protein